MPLSAVTPDFRAAAQKFLCGAGDLVACHRRRNRITCELVSDNACRCGKSRTIGRIAVFSRISRLSQSHRLHNIPNNSRRPRYRQTALIKVMAFQQVEDNLATLRVCRRAIAHVLSAQTILIKALAAGTPQLCKPLPNRDCKGRRRTLYQGIKC